MYMFLAKLTVFMVILIIIHEITKISRFAKHHIISLTIRDIAEMLIFYTVIMTLVILSSFLLIGNAETVMHYYYNSSIAVPIVIFIAAVSSILNTHID